MSLSALLSSVDSWPTLFVLILIYGFAPGFLLRLIVLAYNRDDPRRAELIAELYSIPRHKRPFWVAEQVETAIFDGLFPRTRWALTGRLILRWKLESGVRLNQLHPSTFWVPSEDEKDSIAVGDLVKLMFAQSDGWIERMWVLVEEINGDQMSGSLSNDPLAFPRLHFGATIKFRRDHIIGYDLDPHTHDSFRRHTYTLCENCQRSNVSDADRDEGGSLLPDE